MGGANQGSWPFYRQRNCAPILGDTKWCPSLGDYSVDHFRRLDAENVRNDGCIDDDMKVLLMEPHRQSGLWRQVAMTSAQVLS